MSKPTTPHQPQGHQTSRQAINGPDLIQLHDQACTALQTALHLLTDPRTAAPNAEVFGRALARAMRATSALKQICAQSKNGGAA